MSASAPSAAAPQRWTGAKFLGISLIWGASFLFIKIALEGISPAQVMLGRLMFGAVFLVSVMLVTRRRWPRGARTWGVLALIAIFQGVLPFTLFGWAGQHLPSGISAIYNATAPITTLLVSLLLLPDERLTRARIFGLLLASAGVVVIAGPWRLSFEAGDASVMLAHLACLGATTCYGIAYVIIRRVLRAGRYDATTIAASQITLGAVIGLLVGPLIGGFEPIRLTPEIVWSMLALGVLGTGLAYIWNNEVIGAWGASAASTSTYIIPVVGVVLGMLVLGEVLHWNEPVGGVLVLLGVLASQGRLWSRPPDSSHPSSSHSSDRS